MQVKFIFLYFIGRDSQASSRLSRDALQYSSKPVLLFIVCASKFAHIRQFGLQLLHGTALRQRAGLQQSVGRRLGVPLPVSGFVTGSTALQLKMFKESKMLITCYARTPANIYIVFSLICMSQCSCRICTCIFTLANYDPDFLTFLSIFRRKFCPRKDSYL